MNINSNVLFNNITTFLAIVFMASVLNVILFIALPKYGIDMKEKASNDVKFLNYTRLYEETKILNVPVKIEEKSIHYKNNASISKMTLKAIYAKGESEGWIIVKITTKKKSHILKQNDFFLGFRLIRFNEHYIIFEKDNSEYKLQMKPGIDLKLNEYKQIKNINQDIIVKKDKIIVSRKFLNKQIENEQELMKSILIIEKKSLGKSIGFEILRVKENSFFDIVNLKKGDIIKSINNQEVSDYNKLLSLYKNIDGIDFLIIKINRQNKDMELQYEIN